MTSISDPTSLDNGGLNITVTMPIDKDEKKNPIPNPKCEATYENSSWGVQTCPTWMAADIEKRFMPGGKTPDVITALIAPLKKKLSGQNRWIFPGNGTFIMKNPMFNENGDLLVEIAYS